MLLVLYFTLPAMAGWVVKDWMPDILKEQFDIGQGRPGSRPCCDVQLASLARRRARRLAGRSLDAAHDAAGSSSAPSAMTLFLPALFGVGHGGALARRSAFLILFGLGWGFFDCNNMPILCQIVRPDCGRPATAS